MNKIDKTDDRLGWVDVARCLLITLVVIGHVIITIRNTTGNPFYPKVLIAIYTVHMPAFFILSGLLFNEDKNKIQSYSKIVTNKAKHILLPYVTFEVIGGVYHIIADGATLRSVLYNLLTGHVNVGADWFLISFFFGNLVFAGLYKTGLHNWLIPTSFLMCSQIMPPLIPAPYEGRAWVFLQIYRTLIAAFCIWIGWVIRKEKGLGYKCKLSWLVILIAVWWLVKEYNGQIDICDGNIGNPILFAVGAVAGTVVIFNLSYFIDNCRIAATMRWVGRNAIVIMGTHHLILYYIRSFTSLGQETRDAISIFIVIVAIELPLILLFERVCPRLIGR